MRELVCHILMPRHGPSANQPGRSSPQEQDTAAGMHACGAPILCRLDG